ncbi:hypothetical protein D5W64_12660 [Salmonella enterica subsp. enterica serovar Saintpaul]|nr:hypothetical protein [Salmonella enterica subsp. enterica serovar Saintpaul]
MSNLLLIFNKFEERTECSITTFIVSADINGKELKYVSLPFKQAKVDQGVINEVARMGYASILQSANEYLAKKDNKEVFTILRRNDFLEDLKFLEIPVGIFRPSI